MIGQAALAQMTDLDGTGRASTNPAVIADAATQGRVATLFIPAHTRCWDHPSPRSPTVVQLATDQTFAPCELLDQAAVDTLTRGGVVHTLPTLPGNGDLPEVFRY